MNPGASTRKSRQPGLPASGRSAVGTKEDSPGWSPPRRTEPWVNVRNKPNTTLPKARPHPSSRKQPKPNTGSFDSAQDDIGVCRGPRRAEHREAPGKMHLLLSLRPSVSARAHGSKERNLSFVLPRVPSAAADSTRGYHLPCLWHSRQLPGATPYFGDSWFSSCF